MARNLLTVLFVNHTMATEKPKYIVIEQSGTFELRAYKPMIIAETRISGTLNGASSRGFRVLADEPNNPAVTLREIARYNPPWTLPAVRRNEIMVAY